MHGIDLIMESCERLKIIKDLEWFSEISKKVILLTLPKHIEKIYWWEISISNYSISKTGILKKVNQFFAIT